MRREPANRRQGKDVVIGDDRWIGINALILPGAELGPHTHVGSGSVLTNAFPQGRLPIAGSLARLIKSL